MKSSKATKRKIWVASAILFWLAIGLSLPFIFEFASDDIQLDNVGVVAAPGDRYQITSSLLLDKASGTVISGGTLAIVAKKDKHLTAEQTAKQLKDGQSVLLLDSGEISIGTQTATTSGPFGISSAPLIDALQKGNFKAFGMRESTIIIAFPHDHQERLTRARASVMQSDNGSLEAKGEGFWRGQRAKFSLVTSPISKDGSVDVKLKVSATLVDLSYDGKFDLRGNHVVEGQAVVDLKDTERFANALGTSWPISTSVQTMRIEGPLRWKADILAFDQAIVHVDKNEAKGTVSLNKASGQTSVSSTLAFDKLDIASYLSNGIANSRPDHIAWQWWSNLVSTLSSPSAPHVNADIRLSAKNLTVASRELGPAAATISMKNGKLSADIAEITFENGRATGQLSIDFNRFIPKLTLRGNLEDIATGKWVEAIGGARYIEGKGRVVADLVSHGTSVQQIISALSGRVEFSAPGRATIGISLAELDAARSKNQTLVSRTILTKALKGATAVTNLEAICQIKDGIGTITKASAQHAGGTLKAAGQYDLGRTMYNFRMLSLTGINPPPGEAAIPKTGEPAATKPSEQAKKVARAPQKPKQATLLSIKSIPPGKPSDMASEPAMDVRLRPVTGSLPELEEFLGPNYKKTPRQAL
jgi:AsmA protein